MTKARAMDAAQGLLALPGADEVTRRAVQASTLADQLLEAARANRANLLTLVHSEVEAALKNAAVARLADVDAARAALTAVTKELADLRAMLVATRASAVAGASRSSLGRSVGTSGAVTTAHRPSAPVAQPAPTPLPAATKRASRKAASAKKATAKKATAKKATARKTTAKKGASAKKGAPAKKAAPAKQATAKTATAKTTTKRTTKRTTAKRTTAKRAAQ
jgi:hypothetical protein